MKVRRNPSEKRGECKVHVIGNKNGVIGNEFGVICKTFGVICNISEELVSSKT